MSASGPHLSIKKLRELALEAGLSVVALTDLTPLSESVKPLRSWQKSGYAGAMQYMNRNAELLTEAQKLLPEGKSALCVATFYTQQAAPLRPQGYGRVARYAWGRDYHEVLKQRLEQFLQVVEAQLGRGIRHRIFSDAVPLLERALAARAGLGFIGKNSMLIIPGRGSFSLLAEILWDVELTSDSLGTISGDCGRCARCLSNCPTEAFVGERVLDARRCISYLSIEKRGGLLPSERAALGEWVFGCDVCQEVCPFNHRALKENRGSELIEFGPQQGVGPLLRLADLLTIRRDEDFRARFRGTALLRAKRQGLLRNAACVAANTLAEDCAGVLTDCIENDPDAVVRSHALWAVAELKAKAGTVNAERWERILEGALSDPDSLVREEAGRFVEGTVV